MNNMPDVIWVRFNEADHDDIWDGFPDHMPPELVTEYCKRSTVVDKDVAEEAIRLLSDIEDFPCAMDDNGVDVQFTRPTYAELSTIINVLAAALGEQDE